MCLTLVSMVTTSDSALIHCKNVLLSFDNTKSKGICGVVYVLSALKAGLLLLLLLFGVCLALGHTMQLCEGA